jgi:hypothetical protein
MAEPIPQSAYDSAAAVFSRAFRFVEWRFVIATTLTSTPFGDRDEPQRKATTPIDRQKWIYVFRNNHEREVYAAVHEEIRIDKNGEMAATPADDIVNRKPIKQRSAPVALGKTMCLPRRIKGKPQVYRFFASRVRLEKAQIEELEKKISNFAPPVIFDPSENLSIMEQDGELLVPVVDPVTVALHLHAAFVAAADDVINYTAAHKDNKYRRNVERRRKKQLLATLLKGIIGDEKNTGANNLVAELKQGQFPLESFLKHYDGQLQWRVDRRDRLGAFLTRWLASDGVKIASVAFLAAGMNEWVKFLVPWCHAITRLGESPPGRKFIAGLLDDKDHFVHTFVWPEEELSEEKFQAVRKGGMTVIEGFKTFVEIRAHLAHGGDHVAEIYEKLQRLRREKFELLSERLTVKSIQKGAKLEREIRATVIKSEGHAAETAEKVRQLRAAKNKLLSGPLTPESIRQGVAIDRKISATLIADVGEHEAAHHFTGELNALGAVLETINLILAIKATQEALEGDDPHAKEMAVVGLVKASFEEGAAIAALLKRSESAVAFLGFVAGILETYLSHEEMEKAFKDGDQDAANGSFLTATGATIGTAGSFMVLMAVPGANIVVVIGLLVVALGFLYKIIKGKAPIERFFAHCTWGKEYGEAGGGDWSPTRFEQWKGDSEFDYQFEALLNIICKIEISKGQALRDVEFKMGWLPPDSTLTVKYEETWRDDADSRSLESEILVADKGPVSSNAAIAVYADGANGVKISPATAYLTRRDLYVTKEKTFNKTGDTGEVTAVNDDLKKILASGKLLVTLDGSTTVKVPHKDWEKKTIYDE